MVANEPGFELRFNPGSENCGADLLSRPPSKKMEYGDVIVTRDGLLRVEREKKGFFNVSPSVGMRRGNIEG